jgi:PAS domain S-box-containing protein
LQIVGGAVLAAGDGRMSSHSPDFMQALRARAEAALKGEPVQSMPSVAQPAPERLEQALHDLQVHQIELEMQNQELRRTQAALDISNAHYFDFYDLAPVGYITVDEVGLIQHVNLTTATLLGYERRRLIHQPIQSLIAPPDQDIYYLLSKQSAKTLQTQSCELRMRKHDASHLWVNISAISVQGSDPNGAPVLRMVVSDMSRQIREQLAREDSLRQHALELQALSRRVLEVQETERRRMAIELHDELGQSLTAIKINLQSHARFKHLSQEDLNAENLRIVEDAVQHVRQLAMALRPPMLDDLGLTPALRWMAEQHAERSNLVVDVYSARLAHRLEADIETACFRIAQEALTNIARHAQATRVTITLDVEDDSLLLWIQDDGCGFDVAHMRARALAGGSVGVLGMQERAELIGGKLVIESAPNHGSTVRLRCPLRMRTDVP